MNVLSFQKQFHEVNLKTIVFVFILAEFLPVLFCLLVVKLTSWDFFVSHLYVFGTIAQLLMDIIPLVFMVNYLQKIDLKKTFNSKVLLASFIVVFILLIGKQLFTSGLVFMGGVPAFQQSLQLSDPSLRLISLVMAFIAYGPGEALYIASLLKAFGEKLSINKAIVCAAVIWGLGHMTNVLLGAPLIGAIENSLIMVLYGIFMGVVYKYSEKSPLSIIILWSITNGTIL